MALAASERTSSCLRRSASSSGLQIAAVLLVVALSFSSLHSETRKPTEYEVKAAYLYNFGKFIKWPPSSESTFEICVFGNDPFGISLDSLTAGESLDGKRLAIRRISSTTEAQKCRILYVSRSEQGRAPSILEAVKHLPILTVSDIPNFLDDGGVISFVMQGDRVRFQVSLPAAERAGLSLSSELLKVAVSVKRES
jgi:hypothetical protein